MPSQLDVTNEALRLLGDGPIQTVSATTPEAARVMAAVYRASVEACLEQGDWNFASVRFQPAQLAVPPVWGYTYAYNLPADCLRLTFVSATGMEHDDLINYQLEQGAILTDENQLFIRYMTSNAIDKPGAWPQVFADFVSGEMAFRGCPKLNPGSKKEIMDTLNLRRKVAFSSDAVQQPPQLRKMGRWASARKGYRISREQG